MEKNFENFDMEQVKQLASSDAGRQLLTLLQQQHSAQMQQAMDSFQSGNLEQAQRSLAAFMADPKTKALLKQLQEEQNGRNGR